MIDREDREFVAKHAIRIVGGGTVIIAAAGVLGLAVRVFSLAAG